MDAIAQTAYEMLKRGETFILATIVSHSGSTPRTAGSRMIVTADGRGIGTIGGGLLEAGSMSRAVELIDRKASAILPFDLSFESVDSMDMICGGRAEVLLACIRPTTMTLTVFDAWRTLMTERQPGWLLTVVVGDDQSVRHIDHCLLKADGEMTGRWPLSASDRERVAAVAAESTALQTVPLDEAFVVVMPALQPCTVHLFGAGHVALYTAKAAAMVGFRVVVADDREAYANPQRFPEAHEVRVLASFEQAVDGLGIGRGDYIVILTRGHLHDRTVLAQALKTDAGYIGMIGSRRKRDAIYTALLKRGVSQADIDRVHSPIGLAIGAETPEEIAVSIVAEMIRHRASKQLKVQGR